MLRRGFTRFNPLNQLSGCSSALMEQVADFASERGSQEVYTPWMLTDLMQNTFGIVHDHLPLEFGWLGSVAVSAILVRALIFPLCLQSIREGRLKSTLLPQYSEMLREMSEMKTPTASKGADKLKAAQKKYVAFTAKYGNVALKGTLASGIQIPMIMTGIVAANGIASHPHLFPSVALESSLWLTSASLPDPLYILPLINASLVAFNMNYFGSIDSTATPKVHLPNGKSHDEGDEQNARLKELITSRMGSESATKTSAQIDAFHKSKFATLGKKFFPVLIFGITSNFPAITLVYTTANIVGAMGQNYLVSAPFFQRIFEIPAAAKKSTIQVDAAVQRAEEIRRQITEITERKRGKKIQIETNAKERFLKKRIPNP